MQTNVSWIDIRVHSMLHVRTTLVRMCVLVSEVLLEMVRIVQVRDFASGTLIFRSVGSGQRSLEK